MGAIRDFGYGLTMQRRGDAPFLTHHPFFLHSTAALHAGIAPCILLPCAYSFVNRRRRLRPSPI